MCQQISFDVNNGRIMALNQMEHDGNVHVGTYSENDGKEFIISPGDFVMLMNYYRWQKENGLPIF